MVIAALEEQLIQTLASAHLLRLQDKLIRRSLIDKQFA